ncbi:haloacid dehalogenase-like family hydrolase [Pseudomonas syringae pv. actinidiae ICMP 18807]|uniref:Haloacid dehalogenase-like family hydrolase n=1 Tax=Pseudomonas syringae pv. actinidiae ICMP 18807 TaxID=1194404 RepID=S6TUP5_PSESF|nr:HAD family hydrolase [Pseudomonas syringae]EPN45742.1 haloacid dehalogenase-like family hydrolase [Pseudomonas syringae pv. actinidiae ICMP 18807]
MISAVLFDAFGTIVRIRRRTNPYLQLMREGRRQGLSITSESTHFAMTANLSFARIADHLGISLSASKRIEMSEALEKELSSIEPYLDAVRAISELQDSDILVGVCSNLVQPYGPVIKELFPSIEHHAFSFELGVTKPDPHIYRFICGQMGVDPGHCFDAEKGQVLMIGDSPKCDRDGPRAVGIMGHHLQRVGHGRITDLNQFVQLVLDRNRAERLGN